MAEPEKTTAQLRTELAALRQRNAHLEATIARWQRLEDTVRFPTFLRELAVAQQCADTLHERFLGGTPLLAVGAEVLAELSTALEELHVAAEQLLQQQEELLTTRQEVLAAQQRYHDLFHFAPDGYLATSMVGVILEANAAATVLLNVAPQRLIGRPLAVFVAKPERQSFRTRLSALAQVERAQAWEISLQPRQQDRLPVELTVRVVRNAQGQASALLWLLRDISTRKRAEEALQQAYAELEQRVQERTAALHHEMAERQHAEEARRRLEHDAQRAHHFALLGRLAAGVSHEIRNPLGAILLHVDLLEEALRQPTPDSPEEIAQSLAEIRAQLAHLDDLVQDHLSLVRVASIQREVQDLSAAMQVWATEMQELATPHSATVCLEGLVELGLVAFHASTLRRAVLNLVQNALDAMPGGGTVTLAGQSTATHVQLQVRDTGSGIPTARLGQIFEPLYTTKPGGTGLGLYITQEIIVAHGGQLTVQSVKGQGTTFTLPRAAAETPPEYVTPT